MPIFFFAMFDFKILCVLLFIWCLRAYDAIEYCSPDSCNSAKLHTLCKFQSEDPARHCIEYVRTIKTWKDKQAILDKLNSRRNKVASGAIRSLPAAENMKKLEWNKELEKSAQRWADQCVKYKVPDIKDSCRDLGGVYVGQSIATIVGEAPGLTPAALVDVWYMELLNINASVLLHYQPSTPSGHTSYDYFTQLVWAETGEVGCGAVKFKERVPDMGVQRNRTIYRLVCNFSPSGNRLNQSVYTEGFPCSRCPTGGNCDAVYKALCSSKTSNPIASLMSHSTKTTDMAKILNTTANINTTDRTITSTTEKLVNASSKSEAEDNFTPFDYFAHLHEFVRPTLTPSPTTPIPCIDISSVDNIIELLKKKLITDPAFKDLMQVTKLPLEGTGKDSESDPNVAAFVSKLYSRKTTPSPTTATSDFVNSTLLVDLVEAVIFRNSDKTRPIFTDEQTTHSSDVSAIKIQAELGEVKENTEFTGHYFFPEDMETGVGSETASESTDSYYDAVTPRLSDVVKEIEDIKRRKQTKDFLDDILDSETEIETTSYTVIANDAEAATTNSDDLLDDVLTRIKRDNRFQDTTDYDDDSKNLTAYKNIKLKSFQTSYAKIGIKTCQIKYSDLLKKIASDLEVLKLNERFHCVKSSSNTYNLHWLLLYALLL